MFERAARSLAQASTPLVRPVLLPARVPVAGPA